MTTHYREIHWIWNKRKCVDKCARLPVININAKYEWVKTFFWKEKKSGRVCESDDDVDAWRARMNGLFSERSCYFSKFYILIRVRLFARREDPRSSTIEEQYEPSSRRNKTGRSPFSKSFKFWPPIWCRCWTTDCWIINARHSQLDR